MPNYSHGNKLTLASSEEPPYLTIGTDVSAKYKGAFCEAKITDVNKHVKLRVLFEGGSGTYLIDDTDLKAGSPLETGSKIEARHPEKKQQTYLQATVTKIVDHSRYTVVFDDGDQCVLRRNSLCLKSGKHFAESETLDQLPLTNPEHFGNPVKVGANEQQNHSLAAQTIHTNSKTNQTNTDHQQDSKPKPRGKPSSHATNSTSSSSSSSSNRSTTKDANNKPSNTTKNEPRLGRKRSIQENNDDTKKLKKGRASNVASTNSNNTNTDAMTTTTTSSSTTTATISSANTDTTTTASSSTGAGPRKVAAIKGRKRRDSLNNGSKQSTAAVADLEEDSTDSNAASTESIGIENNIKFEQIEIGVKLMVQYGKGRTQNVYEAKVNKIETNESTGKTRYFVHYTGWNNRYDEWITKGRILAIVTEKENGTQEGRAKCVEASVATATTVDATVVTNSAAVSNNDRLLDTPTCNITLPIGQTAVSTKINLDDPKIDLKKNSLSSSPLLSTIVPMTTIPEPLIESQTPRTLANNKLDIVSTTKLNPHNNTNTSDSALELQQPNKASTNATGTILANNTQPPVPPLAIPVPQVIEPSTQQAVESKSSTVKNKQKKSTDNPENLKSESKPKSPNRSAKNAKADNEESKQIPKADTEKFSRSSKASPSKVPETSVALTQSKENSTKTEAQATTSCPNKNLLQNLSLKTEPVVPIPSTTTTSTTTITTTTNTTTNTTTKTNNINNTTKTNNVNNTTKINNINHTNNINNNTTTTTNNNNTGPIYRFCDDIDESDCDKKISMLQERMMSLRETYISLKTELAELDRRRKRPRTERSNSEHMRLEPVLFDSSSPDLQYEKILPGQGLDQCDNY